jgi:hypothetical protein
MINTKNRLLAASRQYMHNNLGRFVAGYDKAEIDALVDELEAERAELISASKDLLNCYGEGQALSCKHLNKVIARIEGGRYE